MAFYKDAKPKKMSKEDHLRIMSKWDEEGKRYKKSGYNRSFDDSEGAERDDRPTGRSYEHKAPAYRSNNKSFSSPRFGQDDKPARKPMNKKPYETFAPRREERSFDEKKPAFTERKPSFTERKPAFKPVNKESAPSFDDRFQNSEPENLLSGRNPIREAIKAGRDIEKLLVAKGELSGSARDIVQMAKEAHIPVQVVERSRLDEITHSHQGMLAYASAYRYSDVESMLEEAEEKGEAPFLILLDGITDPMNVGAIIRTAACVGAHGVILPERRAAGLTPSAVKASAGAVEVVKVARVTNLSRTIEMLKSKGIWLYAADMNGNDYRKVDFSGPCALVIGSEGDGISHIVSEACDYKVSLPMSGKLNSLNASVAAGVLMYAIMNGR